MARRMRTWILFVFIAATLPNATVLAKPVNATCGQTIQHAMSSDMDDMSNMPTATCISDFGCDMAATGHCEISALNSVGLLFIPFSNHESFRLSAQATAAGFFSLNTPPPIIL